MYGKRDLKHGYWAVGVEEGSRVQRPGNWPADANRSSSAGMAKLGRIDFEEIPEPDSKPVLIGKSFDIFVDDMFWA